MRDVAWAPSIGLNTNILASGSQDHSVIIWHEVMENGAAPTYVNKAQADHTTSPVVSGDALSTACSR